MDTRHAYGCAPGRRDLCERRDPVLDSARAELSARCACVCIPLDCGLHDRASLCAMRSPVAGTPALVALQSACERGRRCRLALPASELSAQSICRATRTVGGASAIRRSSWATSVVMSGFPPCPLAPNRSRPFRPELQTHVFRSSFLSCAFAALARAIIFSESRIGDSECVTSNACIL